MILPDPRDQETIMYQRAEMISVLHTFLCIRSWWTHLQMPPCVFRFNDLLRIVYNKQRSSRKWFIVFLYNQGNARRLCLWLKELSFFFTLLWLLGANNYAQRYSANDSRTSSLTPAGTRGTWQKQHKGYLYIFDVCRDFTKECHNYFACVKSCCHKNVSAGGDAEHRRKLPQDTGNMESAP